MKSTVMIAFSLLVVMKADAYATRFVAYGDTRSNVSWHQQVVDRFATLNPELVLNIGDLWDQYGGDNPGKFLQILRKNASISSLLDRNLYLVARGNHEGESSVLAFTPTLVRNNSIKYSHKMGNCFFVTSGLYPDTAFYRKELSSAAAQSAKWRFIFQHKPIYSTGGGHLWNGNAGVEALCDKYGVAIVFAGDQHIYQRTHLMYNRAVATKSTSFTSSQKGTVFVVSGCGGAPYITLQMTQPWAAAGLENKLEFTEIDATDQLLTFKARTADGNVFDSFTMQPRLTGATTVTHQVATAKTRALNGNSAVYSLSGRLQRNSENRRAKAESAELVQTKDGGELRHTH